MKIVLIRHGATKGNLEKRYIGRTDEDLCGEGIKKLKEDTCAGIYPPAQAELRRHGIGNTAYTDFRGKRARQVTREDYDYYDYLLCADSANIRNTIRITGEDRQNKVKLLLDFAGRPGCSISDPWYTGDFASTFADVKAGCEGLLEYIFARAE